MATGPEMFLNALINVCGLQPQVEKLKAMATQAADEDLVGQAKEALATVRSFDERFKRIEQAFGIRSVVDGEIVAFDGRPISPGSGPDALNGIARLHSLDPAEHSDRSVAG